VVNNYITPEGGLGSGPARLYFAAGGSGDADWMGRWAGERYQEEIQRAREGAPAGGAGGSNLMGRGWNGMPR
jgi:hypothetical protein